MRGHGAIATSDMFAVRANGMYGPIPGLKAATLIMRRYTQPWQLWIE